MDAELIVRFRRFPQESKQQILRALEAQNRKSEAGYGSAIRGLPSGELEWLLDFQTGLLPGAILQLGENTEEGMC